MRSLRTIFLMMAVLLATSVGVMYWMGLVVIGSNVEAGESQSIILHLTDFISTLKDAETGQRGYLLTGKPEYLEPYHAAVARVDDLLHSVEDFTKDNAVKPEDVAQLRRLTTEKQIELAHTIDLRRDKGFEVALAVVDSDHGKRLMDEIRAITSRLVDVEAAHLTDLRARANLMTKYRTALYVAVCLINLAFLLKAYNHIRAGIAQRAAISDKLRQQSELLAVTLSSIGDGIIVTDIDANITFMNPVAERLTGWSLADAQGQPSAKVFNIINEESRKLVESPVDKVLRLGTVVGLANHTLLIRRDGSELPIDDSGSPIREPDGSVRGVVLVFRDFSEHKDAEKKLRDSLFLINTVTNSTTDLIFAKDRNSRMLMANPATLAVIGKTSEQVLGKSEIEWHDDPEQAIAIIQNDEQVMASGKPMVIEEVFKTPAGDRVYRSTKAPLIDGDDHVFGIVGVSSDVTDRRRMEVDLRKAKEEAEAANIAKDNFLATLSHELRTPLTPILIMLNLWESSNQLPDGLLQEVRIMKRNVELEARLIDDLLDLTRIVRGKMPLNLETVDVHALIESVAAMCRSDVATKRLHLSIQLPAERHHVRGDSARLQQVFWNILKNATKFTPEGGCIAIGSANDEPSRVQLVFRDTGIGMKQEVLSRLFEAFEQGSVETVRQYGGLGLGMAISRAMVQEHGGQIKADSDGPGKGSIFTVTLPCVAPESTHPRQPTTPAATDERKPLDILLVEDHADTAHAMSRLLRSMGHQVRMADSVATALEAALQPFDLLLSDIGLPDGTGVDLIRQIRRQYGKEVAAVALTGYGMDDDVTECREAGFDDHLTKPVSLQKLEAIIQQVGRA